MTDPAIKRGPSLEVPALGYDPNTTHAVVPLEVVSVAQDPVTGQWYGILNVNASFSASSLAINDPTITTQKAVVDSSGNLHVLDANSASNSTHLGSIDTATADLVSDLDTLITNTGRIPSSPAQESGNLATLVANTADLLADGDHLATIDTSTAASKTDLDTLAGIVSGGKGAVKAATNDIVDLATLLSLAGASGDANTVNSFMGRLTKIRDLLNATLNVSQQAAGSASATLQNAQAGNAVGTPLSVLGMSSVVLTVNMAGFTGTVNFEGQEDGTNFGALNAVQLGTNTIASSIAGTTTTAIYRFEVPVAGLQQIQARTSGVSVGTVTVTGHAVPLPYNGKVVNATLYGKSTTAGDTALKVNSVGNQYVLGDFTEQASLSAGSLNADLVASTDVSGYTCAFLAITGTWNLNLTVQGSNDNVNFFSVSYNVNGSSGGYFSSSIANNSNNTIIIIPLYYRYLRIRATSYTSGTINGTLELGTIRMPPFIEGGVGQSGTWTVQPGNTQNTTPWMITQGPTNVGTQIDVSATATNATCTATMPAVSGKTNYISGYEITGLPSTTLSSGDITISGLQNTLTAEFAEATTQDNSLIVAWNPPRAASATNTAVSVSVGALGASSSKIAVNVHGFTI